MDVFQEKEYFTTREVADKFSISQATLESWRKQTKEGTPKGPKWVSFHGSIRYHVKDLDFWTAEQGK